MINYNLKFNFFSALLSKFILAVTPIIITPIIFTSLSQTEAGYYYFVLQLVAILSLMEMGITSSLSRILPKLKYNKSQSVSNVLATSFWSLIALSISGLLIFIISADKILMQIETLPVENYNTYKFIAVFAVGIGMISLPMKVGFGFLVASHNYSLTQKYEIYGSIIKLSLFFASYLLSLGSLFFFTLVTTFSLFFVSFITFYTAVKSGGLSNYDPRSIKLCSLQDIISLSGASFAITISAAFLLQGSVVFVTYTLGLEATAIFALIILVFRSATPFFQILPTLLNPIAAERSNLKNDQYIKEFFCVGISYTAVAVGFITTSALFILRPLLEIWFINSNFEKADYNLLHTCVVILFIGYIAALPSAFGRSIAFGNGLHLKAVIAEFLSALIGCFLMFITYKLDGGLIYLSLVLAAAMSFRGLVLYPLLLSPLLSLGRLETLYCCFGGLINVSVCWGASMVLISIALNAWSSINEEMFLFLVSSIIWVVLNYQLVIRSEDKGKIMQFLKKLCYIVE